jgi:hypothetical protein
MVLDGMDHSIDRAIRADQTPRIFQFNLKSIDKIAHGKLAPERRPCGFKKKISLP